MAWQLHYTSARSDRTGRAGFQFVAETPGLPPGVRAAVAPHMVYRPPPLAPLSPDDEELARFPVAFAYDRVDGHAVLVRCRYVGRDYSGRYGNFFAHAVVAAPEELEGLRPVELWNAPVWAEVPGDGELEHLDDLPPGAAPSPESLGEWLADTGSYDLLIRVLDAVVGVLSRGHGRVVLISADGELIVRWLAVVSYSLPTHAAGALSFITYSAEPDGAPFRVVGTTPDVWDSLTRDDASVVIDLGDQGSGSGSARDAGRAVRERGRDGRTGETGRTMGPQGPGYGGGGSPSGRRRFSRTAARCWRDLDFAGLDALGELALAGDPAVPGELALDRAAAVLALCRGEEDVSTDEQAEAAELLTRPGAQVPEWVWHDLVQALPHVGFDLATALCTWARTAGAADLADRCAARCVVLALERPELRERLWTRLTDITLPAPVLARLESVIAAALATAPDLAEVARIVALVTRAGAAVPGDDVAAAAVACARRGDAADLPAALDLVPSAWRSPLTAGAVAGLEAADEDVRSAALADAACDRLGTGRDWSRFPLVGLHVLRSIGRRHRERRLDATVALMRLGPGPLLTRALTEVWVEPPTVGDCEQLMGAPGSPLFRHPVLAALPSRVFVRAAETGRLGAAETLRLAAGVRALVRDGTDAAGAAGDTGTTGHTGTAGDTGTAESTAGADAAMVLACAETVRAKHPAGVAAALDEIEALAVRATARLTERVTAFTARGLADRTPRFRAEVLAAAVSRARARLVAAWIEALPQGALQSKAGRNELVVVALWLRRLKVTEPGLEGWARDLAGRRLTHLQLETYLRDERELRASLRELAGEARGIHGPSAGGG